MGGGQGRTAGPGLGVEPKKSALRSEPKDGMEWNGMEWNGMEWNGMEWNGMEWNGMGWDGMGWDGMVCVDTFVFTLFSRNKNKTIWK